MKKQKTSNESFWKPMHWLGMTTAVVGGLALVACDVDQTEEGEMPEVNVEGGNMPEYDVDGPDVDVGTETKEIEVPTLDVDLPDEEDNEPPAGDAQPVPE